MSTSSLPLIVATSQIEGRTTFWDARTDACFSHRHHFRPANCVAFSPSGANFVTGPSAADGDVVIWKTEAHAPTVVKSIRHVGSGCATAIAWSPAGDLICVGNNDSNTYVSDAASGRKVATIYSRLAMAIVCCEFSRDGRLLATAAADSCVDIWSCDDFTQPFTTFKISGGGVRALAWFPDSTRIVVTSDLMNTVNILNVALNTVVCSLQHSAPALRCAVTHQPAAAAGGVLVVTACRDNNLYFWTGDGVILNVIAGNFKFRFRCTLHLTFADDGLHLAVGTTADIRWFSLRLSHNSGEEKEKEKGIDLREVAKKELEYTSAISVAPSHFVLPGSGSQEAESSSSCSCQ